MLGRDDVGQRIRVTARCATQIILLSLASSFCLFLPAAAQGTLVHCTTYSGPAKNTFPKEIAAYFGDLSTNTRDDDERTALTGIAVQRCEHQGGKKTYTLQFPVQSDLGVCHFKERDISGLFGPSGEFLGAAAPSDSVTLKPHPHEQMVVSDSPCPAHDSGAYIGTASISVGIFRSLMSFWTEATSSKAELERAFSTLPHDLQSRTQFARFQKMMLTRYGNPPRMNGVGLSINIMPQDTTLYQISVSDPNDRFQGWTLGLDLTDRGWKVVRITTWIA